MELLAIAEKSMLVFYTNFKPSLIFRMAPSLRSDVFLAASAARMSVGFLQGKSNSLDFSVFLSISGCNVQFGEGGFSDG